MNSAASRGPVPDSQRPHCLTIHAAGDSWQRCTYDSVKALRDAIFNEKAEKIESASEERSQSLVLPPSASDDVAAAASASAQGGSPVREDEREAEEQWELLKHSMPGYADHVEMKEQLKKEQYLKKGRSPNAAKTKIDLVKYIMNGLIGYSTQQTP